MKPVAVLERLHELASDFQEAAIRGDLTAMDALLSERRALLRHLAPPGPEVPEADRRQQKDLLEAILELDRDAENVLERQRDDLGGQLVALEEGRRGLAGYAVRSRAASRIDERR